GGASKLFVGKLVNSGPPLEIPKLEVQQKKGASGCTFAQLRRHLKKEVPDRKYQTEGRNALGACRVHQELEAAFVDLMEGGEGKAAPRGGGRFDRLRNLRPGRHALARATPE